ncbi:MAG TPA: NAD(P)/FAD-dependent oxidoreductase [Candidatus Norongarragalinales archaeon]|jgi:thioredoxin reductase (NADPH)|nr:NAD(P)/FAD-dependent oxidoreductase [Candidatus Norongarragalinales archaeon]
MPSKNNASSYDMIAVGAGPAACSAAIYASRAKIKTLIIGTPQKSGLWTSAHVENYAGILNPLPGPDLLQNMAKQAKKFGTEFIEENVIHAYRKKDGSFGVKIDSGKEFSCKYLLIATGKAYKGSGITGEEQFAGKGVHYCVACDGPIFKNRKVAVIGNGNYAAEEAIEMLTYTKDVTIYSNGKEFEFSPALKTMLQKGGVKLQTDVIDAFKGQKFIESIVTLDGKTIPFNGVFVAIGTANALSFANKIGLIMEGEDLVIDRDGKTNMENVYAAGLCTGGNNQISKSVGEGCNAAIAIIRKEKNLESYIDHT